MTTGDQIISHNEVTYQGDEFRIASHFLIKNTGDRSRRGRPLHRRTRPRGRVDGFSVSYSIVDWSPKKICADRCMPIPKPADQTDTLERVDADTVEDGQGHVWHRG